MPRFAVDQDVVHTQLMFPIEGVVRRPPRDCLGWDILLGALEASDLFWRAFSQRHLHAQESDVEDTLRRDLTEIFDRRYNGDEYELVGGVLAGVYQQVIADLFTLLVPLKADCPIV